MPLHMRLFHVSWRLASSALPVPFSSSACPYSNCALIALDLQVPIISQPLLANALAPTTSYAGYKTGRSGVSSKMAKPMSFLVLQVLLVPVLLFLLPGAECQSSHGGGANLTVTGTVFCDACSRSSFSNHSYFLPGVRVRIDCTFGANSPSKEEIKITAEKTTNSYGAYQLDIPAIDGVGCTTAAAAVSFCRAAVLDNPSALCNVPALTTTVGHISFSTQAQEPNSNANVCLYNLNSLYYRPRPNKGPGLCDDDGGGPLQPAALNDSLFYCPRWPWPPIPFCTPRPWFPPIPFFTPPPPAFPFPLPPFPPFPFFTDRKSVV